MRFWNSESVLAPIRIGNKIVTSTSLKTDFRQSISGHCVHLVTYLVGLVWYKSGTRCELRPRTAYYTAGGFCLNQCRFHLEESWYEAKLSPRISFSLSILIFETAESFSRRMKGSSNGKSWMRIILFWLFVKERYSFC